MATDKYDLIIVGGGFAGLTAANRAQQLGLNCILIEKGTEPHYLCNSRLGGGVVHCAFRSVLDDPDEMVREIDFASGGAIPETLARAQAENAKRVVEWLQELGADFQPYAPSDGWKDHVFAPHGFHTATGLRWEGLGSDVALEHLAKVFHKAGGTMRQGFAAKSLVMENGRCVGVQADGPNGPVTLQGQVVLADGGFQGNPEMLRRFVTDRPEEMVARGPRNSAGDGIRMAEAIGAKLVDMSHFYGHVLSADALNNDKLSPFPLLDFLAASGIIVDAKGNRFADESLWGVYVANAIAHHDVPGTPQVVFDENTWTTTGAHFFSPANPNLLERGGTLHKADTLAELAAMAGLPAAALEKTVADYNAALQQGTLNKLSPPRGGGKLPPQPIETAPFYAAPGCAAITHTMGGVAVDETARVLDGDDKPIPGLYAAGDVAGGLEGGPRAAYIGALNATLVFGMLAAESAVAAKA